MSWGALWEQVGVRPVGFDAALPMYQVQLLSDADVLVTVADELMRRGHELIRGIEANSCVFPQQGSTPSDPEYVNDQWGHHRIGMQQAWLEGTGAKDIVVAVVDSGINHAHEDLLCNFWDNPCEVVDNKDDDCPKDGRVDDDQGWNFVDRNNTLFDTAGHGTRIAGIVGACTNQTGIVGINWHVSLMDLRIYDTVPGPGALNNLVSAVRYAIQNGAHVINLSVTTAHSWELLGLIQGAPNVIVVTAAGDGPSDGVQLPPATAYPCVWSLPNLICVTSSNETDQKPKTANFGMAIHIAAPGFNIRSTEGSATGSKSGTSFAVPYVTGVAALVKARFRTETTNQIIARVLSGDDVSTLAGMTKPGGTPGTGRRLNACKALGGQCGTPAPQSPLDPPGPPTLVP